MRDQAPAAGGKNEDIHAAVTATAIQRELALPLAAAMPERRTNKAELMRSQGGGIDMQVQRIRVRLYCFSRERRRL